MHERTSTTPPSANANTNEGGSDRTPVLRIATWNVLADAYFSALPPASYAVRFPGVVRLEASLRRQLVVEHMRTLADRNDLVLVQEAEPPLIDALREAGLVVTFHARGLGKPDGIAEIRSRSLNVVREQTRAFDLASYGASRVWNLIEVDVAGVRMAIAAVHLEYDDGRPLSEGGGVGEAQVREMLRALDAIGGSQLIVGDLNAEPGSSVLRALFEAGFTAAATATATPTAINGPHAATEPALHPATNVVGRQGIDVQLATHADWILARGCAARRVRESAAVAPMPRAEMPSDHVPLEAEIFLVTTTR